MIFSVFVMTAAALTQATGPAETERPPISYESLLREMIDRDAIARFPDPAYTCRQASSYDRAAVSPDKPDTWFANGDANQFIRIDEKDGRKEWVLMDAAGPGAVVRFWSANPRDDATIRFYMEGAEKPALEVPMSDLLGGTWRVGTPLSAVRGRGWNCYLPIPYANGCRITSDKDNFYYQINYRTYTPGTAVESFSMPAFEKGRAVLRDVIRELTDAGRLAQPRPAQSLHKSERCEPGHSLTLPLRSGPAAVRELTVRLRAEDIPKAYRNTVLRIDFDSEPTVWCPVGDFFGSGVGVNPFRTWWQTVEADGSMTCRWPMPYEKSASIALENFGDVPVDCLVSVRMGDWKWCDRSMHFHATWRQQYPIATATKHDWNYVEVTGRGVYAGDVLALVNPAAVWWGEGDEKVYVDGEAFPSHFGTGTEDYYGYAWGDWNFFEAPFHAQPRVEGPLWLGHTTVTRTRGLDGIPFTRSLKFDVEVWHWRAVEEAYAAVTYYYARPGATDNRLADRKRESLGIATVKPVYRIPHAVEAEAMEVVSVPKDAEYHVEGNWRVTEWSGDAQLWFGCKRIGDAVELRYPKALRGPQKLILYGSRRADYGIIRVLADGKPLGQPIDLYNPEGKGLLSTGPIDLGTFEPGADFPILRFEVTDSNPEATKPGTRFGIDCVVFTPNGERKD